MSVKIKNKIDKWIAIHDQLNLLKKQESDLRDEIAEALVADKDVGTHKFVDMGIKVVKKVSYKLDKSQLEEIMPSLSEAEQSAINWKPELSLSVYKKIEHEMLDSAVTVTPSKSSIDVL